MHVANHVLQWLREDNLTPEEVDDELKSIKNSVHDYHAAGFNWLSLFREKALFARLWRATLLQFMAQMCGATAMKYYLPTLFRALGLSTRVALMASAIEMTMKIGCTVIEMLIIDRLGRKLTLIAGAVVMALGMLVSPPWTASRPRPSFADPLLPRSTGPFLLSIPTT
jgi:Na+/melibiose symporter-like transporter